jgi:hypothetical protein
MIKSKDKDHGFKIAKDGRLIITDSIDCEISNKKKIKENKLPFIGCGSENDSSKEYTLILYIILYMILF